MIHANNLFNNLPYTVQNSYAAAATLIAANTLFIETAGFLAGLARQFFLDYCYDDLEQAPDDVADKINKIMIGAVFFPVLITSVAVMNIALSKLIKFPFNSWAVAGIGCLCAVSFTALRMTVLRD